MVQELKIGDKLISSFYQLLGEKENDMTYSLGFVLSRSSNLLSLILKEYDLNGVDIDLCTLQLQRHDSKDKGYSDIEVWNKGKLLLIIEAKRGWSLPGESQLQKYSSRFTRNDYNPVIGVLSECSLDYASRNLDRQYRYCSWLRVYEHSKTAYNNATSVIEKNYLGEFSRYLNNLIKMDREQSNWVYCVSLSQTKVNGSDASFIDIVYKYNRYFFPFNRGGGWPLEAPNYIAFRFNGLLQSIHKVEHYEVNDNLHQSLPEVISDTNPDLHFLLYLGPAIKPTKQVKNGNIWPNGRVWCMIDTLLTSDTIYEARNISDERMRK